RRSLLAFLVGTASAFAPLPGSTAQAQDAKTKTKAVEPEGPPKTLADVPYGTHPRQVLDFWKAEVKEPAPLVVYIHGGGWVAGDKSTVRMIDVKKLLDNGISVAAINYRYNQQGQEAGIQPPVKWPLEDAARALQFLRSKSVEWNIDKARIGATGGS